MQEGHEDDSVDASRGSTTQITQRVLIRGYVLVFISLFI